MISLLGSLANFRNAPKPEPKTLVVDGIVVSLTFKRNARCKRMVLRLTPDGAGVVMTLSLRTSMAEALKFAESSKPWIAQTMAKRSPLVAFADGNQILFQGQLCTISATGGRRGIVVFSSEKRMITVPGEPAHLPRRLSDWLKVQAKLKLQEVSQSYALVMQTKFLKITIRDQKSRWGSCSATGELSYSWRLILAPPEVLDYVAAHEVAHLKEMNHGPRFWRLVISHCAGAKHGRNWLRTHGKELHRYGASAS